MRGLLISSLLAVIIALSACASAEKPSGNYTLYLVRHAEKQASESPDPALTPAGEMRANNLAVWLRDKDINDIWSSDYQRTRDTAAPFAVELDLEVKIYNPRELQTLASDLQKHQRNALVVGHSNTTPELASLLCNCSVDDMDETEYDRLIVIDFRGGIATLETLSQ